MQDEQIVALYWDRKEDAIRQTQQKYGAYLSKIAYNILSDLEDSKECVNDTYLKAWNSMPTHRPSVLNLCQRVYRVTETRVTELSEEESSRMAMDF